MTLTSIKHLLTGEELSSLEILQLIEVAQHLKQIRINKQPLNLLEGKQLTMLFEKPSFRTRLSFAIAMQELGGNVVESVSSTRKSETPEDLARVLNGYCHAIMARTHDDSNLQRMSTVAKIPIINGLSNLHHPCQILADFLTLKEQFGQLSGVTVAYVGDGNNILHSLLLLAPQIGVNVHYACPITREPNKDILEKSLAKVSDQTGQIQTFQTAKDAVKDAQVVYTDVWASMGFESQAADNLFVDYQVNETLMAYAQSGAKFMHCLPMERGKEVSNTLPDSPCSIIFQQSENRLHIQKAILLYLLGESCYV